MAKKEISIPEIQISIVELTLVGDSPLICHRFDEKQREQILAKQQKRATSSGREAKDPEELFQRSLYKMPDGKGNGFPSSGLKNCAVDACSFIPSMTKVAARGSFHVVGDLCLIEGEPTMREDTVRIGRGVADIRYRAQFIDWTMPITVRYSQNVISAELISQLFQIAGFSVGIGDWRPQRDGSYGMFHVG